MKLKYLVKTLYLEINRLLGSFVILTIMLGISFSLLIFESAMYLDYIYRIVHNESVLSVDTSQLYLINTEYYKIFWNEEEMKKFYEFIIGLNDEDEGICSGTYYTTYITPDLELLCVSETLLPIGKLSDIDGNDVKFDETNSIVVGYGLKDEYPIGTMILDEEHGVEYRVSQILERDSEWLANDASGGLQGAIKLDDFVLMDTNTHLENSGYVNILNAANNSYLYHSSMTQSELNDFIQKHADSEGIRVYEAVSLRTKTSSKLVYAYRSQSVELFFVLICFLISIIAQYLSVTMNLEYRKTVFGILLACKWTERDIQKLSFMECGLRLILGLAIAIPCSYFAVLNMLSGTAMEAYHWILPILIVIIVLMNLFFNKLIAKKISKYRRKELLEGVRWK